MKKLIETIQKANNIAILTHKNADNDDIGSVGEFLY